MVKASRIETVYVYFGMERLHFGRIQICYLIQNAKGNGEFMETTLFWTIELAIDEQKIFYYGHSSKCANIKWLANHFNVSIGY